MPTLKRQITQARRPPKHPARRASAVPTVVDFTTPNIDFTFNVRVVLSGLPKFLTNTGKLPVSASQTSPTVIRCAYDTPGTVTSVTIPDQDPAVRSRTGGYVSAGTFPAT